MNYALIWVISILSPILVFLSYIAYIFIFKFHDSAFLGVIFLMFILILMVILAVAGTCIAYSVSKK